MIRVICPRCQRQAAVPEEARARSIPCLPPCSAEIDVPQAGAARSGHATSIRICRCGARLRLRETASRGPFRCPVCREVLTASATGSTAPALARAPATSPVLARFVETTKQRSCPICQSAVEAGEATTLCPVCEQGHHQECRDEMGGCSSYGCSQAPMHVKRAEPPRTTMAWEDVKTCPVCRSTIPSDSLRCGQCRAVFPSVDHFTLNDLYDHAERQSRLESLRKWGVFVFCLSLPGVFAPVVVVLAIRLLNRGEDLVRAGPIYRALAMIALSLSILYMILGVAVLVLTT